MRNKLQRLLAPKPGNQKLSEAFGGIATLRGFSEEMKKELAKVVTFDYMGNSEFEFGTIPRCMYEMYEQKEKYVFAEVTIRGKKLFLLCRGDFQEEYCAKIDKGADTDYGEEYHGLNEILVKGENSRRIQGWLDLTDKTFLFINEEMARAMCEPFIVPVAK